MEVFMDMSHAEFSLFFVKMALILGVAYGIGWIVRFKFPDVDFIVFRRCALGFMILNAILVIVAENAGISFFGGTYWFLEIIKFLIGYFAAWASLCGLERRELGFHELLMPSFYWTGNKKQKKKTGGKPHGREF